LESKIFSLKLSNSLSFKKNIIDYFFVFSILIFSSAASVASKADELLICAVIISCFLNIKNNKIQYTNKILKISCVFLIILFVYYIKNTEVDLTTWLGFYFRILLAYNVVNLTKGLFTFYLIKLMYLLCIISIVLFSLQLIEFDQLFRLNNFFGLEAQRGLTSNSNSLIFNMVDIHRYRNSGFMWEPGAFSAIIIFTLFFSLINEKKLNKYNLVFIIAVLTTLSTTGYLSLLVLISYFYLPQYKFLAPILLVVFLFSFSNVSFLSSKINSQILSIEDELLVSESPGDYVIHLNRFASLFADYNTLKNNPLLGLGIDLNTTGKKEYLEKYGENIVRSSGLMFSLLKLGIIGTVAFFFILNKNITKFTRNRGLGFLFCFIYLIAIFSNPIDFSVIILTFIFL
jgi:hypothetical protein